MRWWRYRVQISLNLIGGGLVGPVGGGGGRNTDMGDDFAMRDYWLLKVNLRF